tara:strand:- start:257 stop:460 length:204 start_codon:yes stop_codon:yes gene_type:complete
MTQKGGKYTFNFEVINGMHLMGAQSLPSILSSTTNYLKGGNKKKKKSLKKVKKPKKAVKTKKNISRK